MMDVAVVVPSHDRYSDIWPIAAELFKRFWPDRQWPMYWLSNSRPVPEIAKPIYKPAVDRDQWGAYIAEAIKFVPEPFILFWIEELFLLSPVPNNLFLEAAEILRTSPDVGTVHLTRYYTRSNKMPASGNFVDYPSEAVGRCSALPTVFRREILIDLLQSLPKGNEFEQQSADVMRQKFPNMRSLISIKPMFRFCDNPLLAGVWRSCAIKHMNDLGFDIDFGIRGISPDVPQLMDGAPA